MSLDQLSPNLGQLARPGGGVFPKPAPREDHSHAKPGAVQGARSVGSKVSKLLRRFARAAGLTPAGLKRLEVLYTDCDHKRRAGLKGRMEHLIKQLAVAHPAPEQAAKLEIDRKTILEFLMTGKVKRRAAIVGGL